MATVRGTQTAKPLEIEFTKDTVYERRNVKRIEEPDTDERRGFSGWEYEETLYTVSEWHRKEALATNLAIAELAEALMGGED